MIVALGAVSVVIAAVVIFSSGGSTTRPEEPEAKLRTSGESLIVGNSDAPTKVVVFEDFGDRQSREFEIASRDFLQVEAAQGDVHVEYRPFHLTDGYSLWALECVGAPCSRAARRSRRWRSTTSSSTASPLPMPRPPQTRSWRPGPSTRGSTKGW